MTKLGLDQEYAIRVSTVVNGHAIAKKTEKLKPFLKVKKEAKEEWIASPFYHIKKNATKPLNAKSNWPILITTKYL